MIKYPVQLHDDYKLYQPVEFILNQECITTPDGLYPDNYISEDETLQNEICKILYYSKPCNFNTCGLHYHISSPEIILDSLGLIFLIDFIIDWHTTYQDVFLKTFPYQNTAHDLYNKSQKLIDEKDNFITCFREIPEYGEKPYSKKNNITKNDKEKLNKLKVEIITNLTDIEPLINCTEYYKIIAGLCNGELPNRPLLTVVVDSTPKLIHFEFRGLIPLIPLLEKNIIKDDVYMEEYPDIISHSEKIGTIRVKNGDIITLNTEFISKVKECINITKYRNTLY
jgi:hypothetical protein